LFGMALVENAMAWTQSQGLEPDVYDVESFTRDGAVVPPLVTDPVCWRRFSVSQFGVSATLMDGSKLRYRVERGEDGVTLTLTQLTGEPAGELVETVVDDEHRRFTGTLEGATLDVKVRRLHADDFLLMNRGFHWVNEVPFNR